MRTHWVYRWTVQVGAKTGFDPESPSVASYVMRFGGDALRFGWQDLKYARAWELLGNIVPRLRSTNIVKDVPHHLCHCPGLSC
jgi:hypothetical protein